jgi:tetratricopeptide (TPR) repeat protein
LISNPAVLIRILKISFCFAVAALCILLTGLTGVISTDYQQELAKIEDNISNSRGLSGNFSNDPEILLQMAYYYSLKGSLTGIERDMVQAGLAFDKAIESLPSSAALYLLHAAFNLKLHRLAAAKADLEKISFMSEDPKFQVLKADIDVQEGNYGIAEIAFQHIIERKRDWDNFSRLAYLRWKTGNIEDADQLYSEAEEEISAKEMRSYAWVELQRGLMALSRGRNETAWAHYQRADRAYSGYWLVKEYMAEWLGAQRNFDAAIALYRKLIACALRPELYQALGDLYAFMGKPGLARPWHDKALAVYLASARRGEVQYYHHLATFYADARLDSAEAVKWAQKDIQLRKNVTTHDALAWALYRNDQYPAALEEIKKALSSNWQDAHLYFHAAMIHLATGQIKEGKGYLQKAVEFNPHYDSFHVHR